MADVTLQEPANLVREALLECGCGRELCRALIPLLANCTHRGRRARDLARQLNVAFARVLRDESCEQFFRISNLATVLFILSRYLRRIVDADPPGPREDSRRRRRVRQWAMKARIFLGRRRGLRLVH